ncbi:MAG TPA: alcohol dehydrogenase catalytic domain-containing protein [Dehalococcoidia bacterium]|nr:alcohol dehydrogenase catalytic domain-containing protein [Dehalococcoidia bacterium]
MTASAASSAAPLLSAAAVWTADRVLALSQIAVPAPGAGQAIVRVRACGICGSDLHAWRGGIAPRPGTAPGHELVGEVVALGEGAAAPPPGTRVAVEPLLTCGACQHCARGYGHLCPTRRLLGFGYDGGMSEYALTEAGRLFPLPGDLPWAIAALAEPVAIVHHALKRGSMGPGRRVFVVGAGAIGLLTVLLARAAGADRIGVTARYPQQRAMAERLGADVVYTPDEAMAGSDAARGGWDLVIETVGGEAQTLQQAVDLADTRGTVVLLGVHTAPSRLVTRRVFSDELTIVGAWGYDHAGPRPDFAETVTLLGRLRAELQPLVTHVFPLAQAAGAFAAAASKDSGAIKVIVTPT